MGVFRAGVKPRRFSLSSGADSTIIGVLLLVGVTVAISAGVFIAWQIVKPSVEEAPAFGLRADETQDRLVVVSSSSKADWGRIIVGVESQEGSATAIYMGASEPYQNDPATVAGANVLFGTQSVSVSAASIRAPDFLEFCADIATVNVDVAIVDGIANARMGTWRLSTVDAC